MTVPMSASKRKSKRWGFRRSKGKDKSTGSKKKRHSSFHSTSATYPDIDPTYSPTTAYDGLSEGYVSDSCGSTETDEGGERLRQKGSPSASRRRFKSPKRALTQSFSPFLSSQKKATRSRSPTLPTTSKQHGRRFSIETLSRKDIFKTKKGSDAERPSADSNGHVYRAGPASVPRSHMSSDNAGTLNETSRRKKKSLHSRSFSSLESRGYAPLPMSRAQITTSGDYLKLRSGSQRYSSRRFERSLPSSPTPTRTRRTRGQSVDMANPSLRFEPSKLDLASVDEVKGEEAAPTSATLLSRSSLKSNNVAPCSEPNRKRTDRSVRGSPISRVSRGLPPIPTREHLSATPSPPAPRSRLHSARTLPHGFKTGMLLPSPPSSPSGIRTASPRHLSPSSSNGGLPLPFFSNGGHGHHGSGAKNGVRAQTMRISNRRRHVRSHSSAGLPAPPIRRLSPEFKHTLNSSHPVKPRARTLDDTLPAHAQSYSSLPQKRHSTPTRTPRSNGLPPLSPSQSSLTTRAKHRRALSQGESTRSDRARAMTMPRRRRASFNGGLPPLPIPNFNREAFTSEPSSRSAPVKVSKTESNHPAGEGRRGSGLPAPPLVSSSAPLQPFTTASSVSQQSGLRADSLLSTASESTSSETLRADSLLSHASGGATSDALRADSLLSNTSSHVRSDSLLSNASSTGSVDSQGGKRSKTRRQSEVSFRGRQSRAPIRRSETHGHLTISVESIDIHTDDVPSPVAAPSFADDSSDDESDQVPPPPPPKPDDIYAAISQFHARNGIEEKFIPSEGSHNGPFSRKMSPASARPAKRSMVSDIKADALRASSFDETHANSDRRRSYSGGRASRKLNNWSTSNDGYLSPRLSARKRSSVLRQARTDTTHSKLASKSVHFNMAKRLPRVSNGYQSGPSTLRNGRVDDLASPSGSRSPSRRSSQSKDDPTRLDSHRRSISTPYIGPWSEGLVAEDEPLSSLSQLPEEDGPPEMRTRSMTLEEMLSGQDGSSDSDDDEPSLSTSSRTSSMSSASVAQAIKNQATPESTMLQESYDSFLQRKHATLERPRKPKTERSLSRVIMQSKYARLFSSGKVKPKARNIDPEVVQAEEEENLEENERATAWAEIFKSPYVTSRSRSLDRRAAESAQRHAFSTNETPAAEDAQQVPFGIIVVKGAELVAPSRRASAAKQPPRRRSVNVLAPTDLWRSYEGISAGASDGPRSVYSPRASSVCAPSGLLWRSQTSDTFGAGALERERSTSTSSTSTTGKRNRVHFGEATFANDRNSAPVYNRARSDAGAGFPLSDEQKVVPSFQDNVALTNKEERDGVEYATDSSSDDTLDPISRGVSLTSTVSTVSSFTSSSSSDDEAVASPRAQPALQTDSGHRFSFDNIDVSGLRTDVALAEDPGTPPPKSPNWSPSTPSPMLRSAKSSTASLLSPDTLVRRATIDSSDFDMGTPRLEWEMSRGSADSFSLDNRPIPLDPALLARVLSFVDAVDVFALARTSTVFSAARVLALIHLSTLSLKSENLDKNMWLLHYASAHCSNLKSISSDDWSLYPVPMLVSLLRTSSSSLESITTSTTGHGAFPAALFRFISRPFPKLGTLTISCDSASSLSATFSKCPNLRSLFISEVTPSCSRSVVERLMLTSGLTSLHLKGVSHLSDDSLLISLSEALPNIAALRLQECSLVDRSLNILASLCQSLVLLDVRGNTQITDDGISQIAYCFPKLEVLCVGSTSATNGIGKLISAPGAFSSLKELRVDQDMVPEVESTLIAARPTCRVVNCL